MGSSPVPLMLYGWHGTARRGLFWLVMFLQGWQVL